MPEKILIPTDFSEFARYAVMKSPEVPGVREVILLFVGESRGISWVPGSPSWTEEEARGHLERMGEELRMRGLKVRTGIVARNGDIHDTILSCAEKEKALVMMGARGWGFIGEFLLGSVSQQVLERARTDVLIMHRAAGKEGGEKTERQKPEISLFSRILLPIDFSRRSGEAVDLALSAEGPRELILLHVIDSAQGREELAGKMADATKKLQYLWRELDDGTVSVQLLIRFGNPVNEILRVAEEEQATLIIISRYGATEDTRGILIGRTAADVAKRAKMPVFVKHPGVSPDSGV